VKRVLFDEHLPRLLRRKLPEFDIRTVQEEGWGSAKNGALLRMAEKAFHVLLTADRRMKYQQTLASFSIGVVVIDTPRLRLDVIESALEEIRIALVRVQPGEVIHVQVKWRDPRR
jgi:hypothetical protein